MLFVYIASLENSLFGGLWLLLCYQYWILTGLLLDILLLPSVMEILKFLDLQNQPLYTLQRLTRGVDTGMGQHKALDLCLVGS